MYSDDTAAKAIATLAILLHDTPLEDTHPDLSAQVNKVLAQAEAEAYEFACHMNQLADPDCKEHCGCGVPFTEDCPSCKEYMGDEYHSPNESPVYETSTITVNEPRKYVLKPELTFTPIPKSEKHD
jgi:hypothetical protein